MNALQKFGSSLSIHHQQFKRFRENNEIIYRHAHYQILKPPKINRFSNLDVTKKKEENFCIIFP